jgi:predicted nucleic-acid-binding protein
MPDFVETSVLVRYLTDTPPAMAERAQQLIESAVDLRITETALIETAHVLRRVYGLARKEVVDLLVDLLRRRNISVHTLDKSTAITALLLCRPSGRIGFGDALIWAVARSAAPSAVYSFDRRFPPDGIDLRSP